MTFLRQLVLASALCIALGAEARADYMEPFRGLTSPEAQNAYSLLKAGHYDTNYIQPDGLILLGYIADPRRAQKLLAKEASGGRLTGGEARGLRVINNAATLIAAFPKPGRAGYVIRPQFYGN